MSQLLLLMRHAESSKNVEDRFAGVETGDELTPSGRDETAVAANHVKNFLKTIGLSGTTVVYSSDSSRALHSGQIVASSLGADHVVDRQLRSVVNPETAGRAYAELLTAHPEMARQWNLYRGGVLSSYDIGNIARNTRPYEDVVKGKLEAFKALEFDTVVVVGHRSFITSSLINIARSSCGYPRDFFGFVPLGHLSVSAVRRTTRGSWEPAFVDLQPQELQSIGVALMG